MLCCVRDKDIVLLSSKEAHSYLCLVICFFSQLLFETDNILYCLFFLISVSQSVYLLLWTILLLPSASLACRPPHRTTSDTLHHSTFADFKYYVRLEKHGKYDLHHLKSPFYCSYCFLDCIISFKSLCICDIMKSVSCISCTPSVGLKRVSGYPDPAMIGNQHPSIFSLSGYPAICMY